MRANSILIMLAIFHMALITGCGSLQGYDKKAFYKKNLIMEVNDVIIVGFGTAPYSTSYKIKIKNHKKMDYLSIESCHRNIGIESPYFKQRVIKNRKEFEYDYSSSRLVI